MHPLRRHQADGIRSAQVERRREGQGRRSLSLGQVRAGFRGHQEKHEALPQGGRGLPLAAAEGAASRELGAQGRHGDEGQHQRAGVTSPLVWLDLSRHEEVLSFREFAGP